jgi:hypothetical protein
MLLLAPLLMPPIADTTGVQRIAMGRRPSTTHSVTVYDDGGGRSGVATELPWRGRLQSHARCQKRRQHRQRRGNLQDATRCDEERQLKHLPRNSSGMRLGPRCSGRTGVDLRPAKPYEGLETSTFCQSSASGAEKRHREPTATRGPSL